MLIVVHVLEKKVSTTCANIGLVFLHNLVNTTIGRLA